MKTNFFTNRRDDTLLSKFDNIIKYKKDLVHFDALVGYMRASGYFKLRKYLDEFKQIRILCGINVDSLTKHYYEKSRLFYKRFDEVKEEFKNELIKDIQLSNYDNETEDGILQFIDDIIERKIELRAHPTKKLHAKIYIFRPEIFNEHSTGEVFTGSSNMSATGLGVYENSNYEFNVNLREYTDVKFATEEFEELWDESKPILASDLNYIKEKTYLKDNFTPYELYIKMLIEYFGERIENDPFNFEMLLPNKFTKLEYQIDAANHAYSIMMKHNGCILADVVGLGKTIMACLVIKKFVLENGKNTRFLVVTPPALQENWENAIKDFQLSGFYSFISIGSLEKILNNKNEDFKNPEDFDIIIIDESHKFRNSYTDMYVALQEICKTPRKNPGKYNDTKKKVIMLSATPLNNDPSDIENQLYLFQDKRNSTLENITNIQEYFKNINKRYKNFTNSKVFNKPKLKALFNELREDIIEPLVIRRTRTDIEKNEDYKKDLEKQGIKFPEVQDPFPINYNLNKNLSELFLETVSIITGIDYDKKVVDSLGYYRYRAIEFLENEEDRNQFGRVKSISERLTGIMKTLLVKRLESSFFAFKKSLKKLQKANQNMIKMLEDNNVIIAPDFNVNELLEKGMSYESIEKKINLKKGGNNKKFTSDKFKNEYKELLLQDQAKINGLVNKWDKINDDPKLDKFLDKFKSEFFNKDKNESGKLVIFSESKDTASQLIEQLKKMGREDVLYVSADNRKHLEKTIEKNFDANFEQEKQENRYDVIITTEVLAEGVNLHRSNVIVNYDVPWNSTKLMQRIGRVNRIGSNVDKIYVYNFFPSAHGDKQINLVNTALRKLQAFHTAFGEDNKVFSVLEELSEGAHFLNTKIKEEMSETEGYLNELKKFKKQNPKKFNEIKSFPDKVRCGRNYNDKTIKLDLSKENGLEISLKNTSLTYLKSNNHPGIFCFIKKNGEPRKLNFLEAVKIFKAEKDEKPIKLHKNHYEQTNNAMEYFLSKMSEEVITHTRSTHLSQIEKTARSHLLGVKKIVSGEKYEIISNCIKALESGRFTTKGLPKEINDFFKEGHVSNDEIINGLFDNILSKKDLSNINDEGSVHYPKHEILNPKIVLTQSFS